ncbi:unnamed protein product [Prunus brigantina]
MISLKLRALFLKSRYLYRIIPLLLIAIYMSSLPAIVQLLLSQYANLFIAPAGLALPCRMDHRISLVHGTPPVNV